MSTLDRIMQMQQEGKSDSQIMSELQNEGISPSEINNNLNQAKIKNAVSPPEPQTQTQQMQPSMMQDQIQEQPQPIQLPPEQEQYQQDQGGDYYTPQPQAYSDQDYYPDQMGYGTENISEIAEQVVQEKLEDYKAKVGDVVSFKNQTIQKINDIDDRLKRIENSIDKLQQAIIGKIGEFGDSSAMIHKDLNNLHGTVSKLMNPLVDNINELRKINKR